MRSLLVADGLTNPLSVSPWYGNEVKLASSFGSRFRRKSPCLQGIAGFSCVKEVPVREWGVQLSLC
jgi:hypothetical protein